MDANLLLICFLTLAIHVAGVRTGRIAISFSLFNILALISRTSNSCQGPFLAKRIESRLLGVAQPSSSMLADFRWLLAAATIATAVGAFFDSNVSAAVQFNHSSHSGKPLYAASDRKSVSGDADSPAWLRT